jgi:hypothetical protein
MNLYLDIGNLISRQLRMKIKMFSSLMVAVLVLTLALLAAPVYAQNPSPPAEPDQSWNPPEEGGETITQPGVESKSSSTYFQPTQPGITPYIQSVYFIDEAGQNRTQFSDEPFYLVVQTNSPGSLHIAEYYTAESGRSPVWLVYRYYLSHAGAWTLGPFYPESSEPIGKHTWRLWLYSSGKWAQTVLNFNYQPYYRSTATPLNPESGGWGALQVLIVAILTGALGITIGMLVASRKRYNN